MSAATRSSWSSLLGAAWSLRPAGGALLGLAALWLLAAGSYFVLALGLHLLLTGLGLALVAWLSRAAEPPAGTLSARDVAIAAPLGLLIPFFVSDSYGLGVAINVLLYASLAIGLNIMVGYLGLLDLGYVGFYAIGAYASAICTETLHLSFWASLPVAVLAACAGGLLVGTPTLRLSGDYFAIVTFGFAELVTLVIRNWTSVTRGARGIPGIALPALPSWSQDVLLAVGIGRVEFTRFQPVAFYILMFLLFGLTVFIVHRLECSRPGRAWAALREDEVAARALGVNLRAYRLLGFAVASGIGGMCGAFFASYSGTLHWSSFIFMESVLILCMVVLGGMGSLRGAILGAGLLVLLQEALRDTNVGALLAALGMEGTRWPGEARWIAYGVLSILVMRYRPGGLLPRHGDTE